MKAGRMVLSLFALSLAALAADAEKNTCVECHSALDGDLQRPAVLFKKDIHLASGLTCADCHGGDRTSSDMEAAMNPKKGFVGKVKRTEIPKLCASCHSKPDFMRRYRPQQRVDQFELYQTSVHGKRLAAGDENVATCIDCHSVHDIRAVKDALSPVHPVRLPETCARCHADTTRMAAYKIPTNQFDEYRTSVHWAAVTKRGDLSAPTCASCHGNHGAKPPQVESVAAVCGSCHVLFAQLYDKSVHKQVFESADSGGGCTVCHSNHGIHQPSTAMLQGPNAVCSGCHEAGSAGDKAAKQIAQWTDGLDSALSHSDQILGSAERYGMEVSEARLKLIDGRENLVKARLAMHSFQLDDMQKFIDAGMKIAGETTQSGEAALKEKDVRRIGLAISVFLIAITLAAIWFLIRRIEAADLAASAPRK